jgi:hypothetical protein
MSNNGKKECRSKCKPRGNSEVKETKVNIAETASLGRDKQTDENQEGYNFVGTLHNWTTEEEQSRKVKEIEKVTEKQEEHVKAKENNNKGRMDLQNLDK